ncbi:unnamed protein product [Protopolystoma xenopodis]|uniref:Uncharacterized protein n=1 Tax=Protopolystoma xenopodis TaxID=117903 RepID=A0A448WRZ2_9PLAT|nr:unnamed protein product [Protopolystoma xenopodis]
MTQGHSWLHYRTLGSSPAGGADEISSGEVKAAVYSCWGGKIFLGGRATRNSMKT